MSKKHKSIGSKNIHVLRNCLVQSSLKYYSLGPLWDLNIGCVTSFWSQEHRSKLSRSIWSCLENCEELHQANQIIPGFKIDSKGADNDSVHIKGSSDAFDRMITAAKKHLMWEPAFPFPQTELICSLENALVLSSSVMETWMLKEGSARSHEIWLPWVLVVGSFVVAHGAFSCGNIASRARGLNSSMACRILVLPPRIKPVSPALQGRFLTIGPPGKSPQVPYFW